MPRKGPVAKRDVLPDPIYNSKLVTKLINKLMLDGKRGTAQRILYSAFDLIKEKLDFNFSATDNPAGYFWGILKNLRNK